jgi:hypothetical protein
MHIIIEGRQYEFPEKLKLGEIRLIKQIANVGMNQIMTALEEGDPNVMAALVLIVMRRAGKRVELEELDELDITEINFGGEDVNTVNGNAVEVGKDAAAPLSNGNQETTPAASGAPPMASTSPSDLKT